MTGGLHKNGKNKKSLLATAAVIAVFLAGIGLLLYPTVADYWNSLHQSRAIESYREAVEKYSQEELDAVWDAAEAYNERLHSDGSWSLYLNEEDVEEYESQLNLEEDGMMGYIEIPKISCSLPIYHGTDDAVLSRNIGHLEGTSLPVGGEGTHAVLSGHRGLTSARLFTDLDLMAEGDTFMLHILGRTLTYEVDQILTVLPEETEALAPVKGKDYCTLVTCTPYGVNDHRLLVRGHRIENAAEGDAAVEDAVSDTGLKVSLPVAAAVILLILLIAVLILTRKQRRAREHTSKNYRESGK